MSTELAWNLLWLRPGVVGGTETYALRLLRAISATEGSPPIDLFVMGAAADRHADDFASHRVHRAPVDDLGAVRRVALERSWFRRQLGAVAPRILHHLGGTVPSAGTDGTVVTVHDLQPLDDPQNFGLVKPKWMARVLPAALERADAICVPSDWVAATIVDRFGIDVDRIHTVSAYAEAPKSAGADEPSPEVAALLRAGPVVLYPAMTLAHKNHRLLFRAFSVAAARRKDLRLVCTGPLGRDHEDLVAAAAALSDRIHLLGHVPSADLAALMRSAELLVFPSRYEGFGLPVLEAQRVGLPVACSDSTALPEVAGDGAVLLPPDDLDAWVDVLADPIGADRRIDLIRRGSENVVRYGPEVMAEAQLAAYDSVT